MGIEVDVARVLSCLFPNYSEFREEVADASDEHSLYFIVCLRDALHTSVTGSLKPFSYFLRFGFSAHSLATWQALNANCVTTEM